MLKDSQSSNILCCVCLSADMNSNNVAKDIAVRCANDFEKVFKDKYPDIPIRKTYETCGPDRARMIVTIKFDDQWVEVGRWSW